MTPAERQKRYRERQKAKLAAASEIPLRDETSEARIAELNAENDALAVKVDQLQRLIKAKDKEIARLSAALDAKHADLEYLRSRVARWKTEDGSETTAEPTRPKARRK
jgi:hypothetical protein